MAWLADFDKRIKVTADHTVVDANLSHFPICIRLGTSVGKTNADVSCVFDELTSDDNRKRIAVTKADGTTQLYVEIEQWDDANEKAVLHCGITGDTLSSSADTDYYLYYDVDHADNTDYVGDTNDVVAESVWDNYFKAVYHMADGASNTAIYDSTSNDKDGTKKAANEPIEIAGKIGQGQDFDGSDDYINIGDFDSLGGGNFTISMVIKPTSLVDVQRLISSITADDTSAISITAFDEGEIKMWQTAWHTVAPVGSLTADQWTHCVIRSETASQVTGFIDGEQKTTETSQGENYDFNTLGIGAKLAMVYGPTFDGIIDEVRISDTPRSAAWIKASYHSGNDSLLTYGSEEKLFVSTDWAKKIKLTTDATKIDANLSHFPLTVFLKAGNGETTKVFDEVGANKFKIAIADGSETPVQLYVEIEQWDDTNRVGILHFGRAGEILPSASNKDYYLYYDNTHADNTDYVGDTNDVVAESVWDNYFKAVYHMPNGADSSHIYDSTLNDNDGTKVDSHEPTEIDGKIGKAQDFDNGTDSSVGDYITVSDSASLRLTTQGTIALFIKPTTTDQEQYVGFVTKRHDIDGGAIPNISYHFGWLNDSNEIRGLLCTSESTSVQVLSDEPDTNWHQVVFLWDSSYLRQYRDGATIGTPVEQTLNAQSNADHPLVIGGYAFGTSAINVTDFDGIIDEVRISSIGRSAAWIKASYHSGNDSLLTYGSEAPVTFTPTIMNII